MFSTVIEWALAAGAIVIGLTGTPIRLDGQSLGGLFQDLIEAKSTRWLIDQGRLSDYVAYTVPRLPDLSAIKATAGDFNIAELADAMDRPTITGDAVAHWRKHAMGLRTVCYCVNVAHSKHTAEAFNAAGIPAVHVDASSTEADIKDACEGLATRRYLVLCNCELVIEGFDLSAQVGLDVTLECCILLRPTQSLARYLQMVFRALRAKPRPAVILDHSGCILRHGLPCDDREWTLAGERKKRKRGEQEPDVNVQQCGHCFHLFRPGVDECPRCGHIVERKERKLVVADGDLEQIDVAAMRKQDRQEQGMARGLRDLVSLGVRKGMNHPDRWAAHVFAARSKRKATGTDYNNARKILMEIKNNEQRNTVTTPDHAGTERAGSHGLA
jgi:superfamily II DNA or RNA helicase